MSMKTRITELNVEVSSLANSIKSPDYAEVKLALFSAASHILRAQGALKRAEQAKEGLAGWWKQVDEELLAMNKQVALLGEVRRYWESETTPGEAARFIEDDRVSLTLYKSGVGGAAR